MDSSHTQGSRWERKFLTKSATRERVGVAKADEGEIGNVGIEKALFFEEAAEATGGEDERPGGGEVGGGDEFGERPDRGQCAVVEAGLNALHDRAAEHLGG